MPGIIIAVVDDLFFASKIRGTAEDLGVTVVFAKTIDAVIDSARTQKPSLIIADLNSERCDVMELAQRLKSDEKFQTVSLIGFFSHVQTELQRRAAQAGFDRVIPRSVFAKNLPKILQESRTQPS